MNPGHKGRHVEVRDLGGDPHGFMVKNQIVEYIEAYAKSFSPPVMEGTTVKRLARSSGNGRFELSTTYRDFTAEPDAIRFL